MSTPARVTRGLRAACTTALATATLLVACADLPDLRRGKEELKVGDTENAEADLLPLAELGYHDAKLALARVYAQRGDEKSIKEAVRWYREALAEDPSVAVPLARVLVKEAANPGPELLGQAETILSEADERGDPMALPALLELYIEHPERDPGGRAAELVRRAEKTEIPETEALLIRWYRQNAQSEQVVEKLIRRCEKALERVPDCYVELARHYRATGKAKALKSLSADALQRHERGEMPSQTLERLGWSLVSEDIPGPEQPEVAYQMLKRAGSTSPQSQVRLARLIVEHPYLDPDAKPEKMLLAAEAQGNQEAALALGRLYLTGTTVAADPPKAEKYLQQAAPTLPQAHYFLGRLYKRGYLGEADPVRAAQHYLIAARSGYVKADLALAELFSDNRGVRANLSSAYVFASLAVRNEVPEAQAMLQQIRTVMKPGDLQKGRQLLDQELGMRGAAAAPASGPQTSPLSEAEATR